MSHNADIHNEQFVLETIQRNVSIPRNWPEVDQEEDQIIYETVKNSALYTEVLGKQNSLIR